MAAIEKFKLGGASATDIAVLVKNHCANETAQDGKRNLLLFSIFYVKTTLLILLENTRIIKGLCKVLIKLC